MTAQKIQNNRSGFSLTEMAIVISVMAVILISFFSLISDLNISTTASDNETRMDEVATAINSFYLKNGYIPCPAARNTATNQAQFGISTDCTAAANAGETVDTGAGSNVVRIGAVPVRTLGLSDLQGFDKYGDKISYAIVKNLGINKTSYDTSTATSAAISIVDRSNNSLTSNIVGTDFIAYTIISHGLNGRGSYNNVGVQAVACGASTDAENCNDDNIFLESLKDPNNYDDSIRWQTQHQLKFNSIYEFSAYSETSPTSRRLFDKYAMITYEFGNSPAGAATTTQTSTTANSWVSRSWNVVRNNSLSSLALGGSSVAASSSSTYYGTNPSQITLGPGTYWIKATAASIRNGYSKLRLNNLTSGSVIEYGTIDSSTPCDLNGATASSVYSSFPFLITVVTFQTTTTITLDQVFSTTNCATNYLGETNPSPPTPSGMHSVLEIWELS